MVVIINMIGVSGELMFYVPASYYSYAFTYWGESLQTVMTLSLYRYCLNVRFHVQGSGERIKSPTANNTDL
jgi:hypothetical protein